MYLRFSIKIAEGVERHRTQAQVGDFEIWGSIVQIPPSFFFFFFRKVGGAEAEPKGELCESSVIQKRPFNGTSLGEPKKMSVPPQ